VTDNKKFDLVVVVGATASGKSALGVRLARDLNGEVVNLDSVQVFREFDIGSGKIPESEAAGVPHHLINILSPKDPLDVNEIVKRADQAIADIKAKGTLAIVVAGTSLYLKCLLGGIIDVPSEDKIFRESLESVDTSVLYGRLKEADPRRAEELAPADRMRIVRSLEIFHLTGMPHSQLIEEHKHKDDRYRALILHVAWSREELYQRIDERCAKMVADGLMVETQQIYSKYGQVAGLSSLGYAQAMDVILGKAQEEGLLSEMQTKTRQFAKRQLTFWRNSPSSMGWKIQPKEEGVVLKSKEKPLKRGAALLDFMVYNWGYSELVTKLKTSLSAGSQHTELWHLSAKEL